MFNRETERQRDRETERQRERERNWEREKEGESRIERNNNNAAITLTLTDTHGLTDVHAPPGSLATATCRRRRCPQTSSKSLLVSPSRLELVSGPLVFPIVSCEAAKPPVLQYSICLPRSRLPPFLLFSRLSLANPQSRKVAGFRSDPPDRLPRSRLLPILRSSVLLASATAVLRQSSRSPPANPPA